MGLFSFRTEDGRGCSAVFGRNKLVFEVANLDKFAAFFFLFSFCRIHSISLMLDNVWKELNCEYGRAGFGVLIQDYWITIIIMLFLYCRLSTRNDSAFHCL